MTVDMKALKEAATLADTTHDPSWRKHVDAFRAISSPSTILSLIERCEELEGALRMLSASAQACLVELKPGQALHPAGAGRTNALESDVQVARRALSKADATS